MADDKPSWWPQLVTPEWRMRIRADYPEDTVGMNDDALDDYYADGWRYATTWDHLGDARCDYQELADAFLKLVTDADMTPTIKLRSRDEQAMIVASLKQSAMMARERSKLLMRPFPPPFTGKYHPNRELAKSWADQAEVLRNLTHRVEGQ